MEKFKKFAARKKWKVRLCGHIEFGFFCLVLSEPMSSNTGNQEIYSFNNKKVHCVIPCAVVT
jgi:hypothetical protein